MGRPRTIIYHYLNSKEMKTRIAYVSRIPNLGVMQYGYAYTSESLKDLPAMRIVTQQLRKVIDIPRNIHFEIVDVTDLTFNTKNNKSI